MATYRVCCGFRSFVNVYIKSSYLNGFSSVYAKDASSTLCKSTLVHHTRSLSHTASHLGPTTPGQQPQKNETLYEEDPYRVEAEKCIICKYDVPISYKNVQLLSQFVSPNTGRIFGRHITRLCPKQQKKITKAIKRAIQFGYMPNQHRETRFLKDPSLYDVRYSGNPSIGQYSKLPDSDISQEELLERSQAESESQTKS